jgi:hypothetical protein
MLEPQIIQMKGFRNVMRDGKTTGFRVQVRCPYYRGIWLSLLENAEVTVNGEKFPPEAVRWTFSGRAFTSPELAQQSELRWFYEEPAILTVDKPGGLEPGLHNVEVSITWRWSYIPVEFQPTTNISRRKLVLVR